MSKFFPASQLIINSDGSAFHIHLKPEFLADKVILVGDGANLCFEKMNGISCDLHIADENVRFQRASSTAFAAEKLFESGKTVSSDKLMPQYLRLPQAQRELIAKKSLTNK